MPRPRDPQARQRIVDAAAPLFYERGIQNVGMAELTEAAGCGKSTIYREFGGKDELVLLYLEQFAARRDARESRILAEAASPSDGLVALVQDLATISDRPAFRGCPFRNYLREFAEPDTAASRLAATWLAARRATIAGLVHGTPVSDPDLVTDQVWVAMEGLWSSYLYEDGRRLGAAAVSLVERLIDA